MKAKRKLVEISGANHRQLTSIRKQCRRSGKAVPSIPALVDEALFMVMNELEKKFCQ